MSIISLCKFDETDYADPRGYRFLVSVDEISTVEVHPETEGCRCLVRLKDGRVFDVSESLKTIEARISLSEEED